MRDAIIPIFIPFVNRPDLLKRAVASVPNSFDWQPEVINNSGSPLPDNIYAGECNPLRPLTFSQTQNWMLELAGEWMRPGVGVPFYLFLHSDAEASEGTVEALIEMAFRSTESGRKWGAIWTAYDALAAYSAEAMQAIGGWDENLPWYLSDCDCYRRLRLAGYSTIDSGLPVKHTPSQTLNSDSKIARRVAEETPKWRTYYRAKWGGDNEHERFLIPFDGHKP